MAEAVPPGAAKTRRDLEWLRVQEAVYARCVGPEQGRGDLRLAETPEEARTWLSESGEAFALQERKEGMELQAWPAIGHHLERVERQGHLDAPALRDVLGVLQQAHRLRRWLTRHRRSAPCLYQACPVDPRLDELEAELEAALEPEGQLSDNASSELLRLRREVRGLRDKLVGRIEELMRRHADLLQDQFFTIREGRYVLPVRADAHERVPGIVHASSASGATVFVEPRSLLGLGNRLKMATAEMEREEARVLGELSVRCQEHVASLQGAVTALRRADLRCAAAKLALHTQATPLDLIDEPKLSLRSARHPLLVLEGAEVVANDIEMSARRGLVISGPNAGGKTIALKTAGLVALMSRAGLFAPLGESSQCGFFDSVRTLIGDDQSTSANLSTFSAHIRELADIVAHAGPATLVLLDELAGATDPLEGAALAASILDALHERGAAVAATTHYEALKAHAQEVSWLRNASVGFDWNTMQPTFELVMDLPGPSSALAVAERFGLPAAVIEAARQRLPERAHAFEQLIADLSRGRRDLENMTQQAAQELEEASKLRSQAEQRMESVRGRLKKELAQEFEAYRAEVRKARAEVRQARRRLRREQSSEEALVHVRQSIEQSEAATDPVNEVLSSEPAGAGSPKAVAPSETVDAGELSTGARVWVPRLNAEAEIVAPPERGRLRVAAGPLKLWVNQREVTRLSEKVSASRKKAVPPAPRSLDAGNTLDVRGMRADEAISMVESFLDRVYGSAQPLAYVLHGRGSGALREAIWERFRGKSRYIQAMRMARSEEGGDRITVFELK